MVGPLYDEVARDTMWSNTASTTSFFVSRLILNQHYKNAQLNQFTMLHLKFDPFCKTSSFHLHCKLLYATAETLICNNSMSGSAE